MIWKRRRNFLWHIVNSAARNWKRAQRFAPSVARLRMKRSSPIRRAHSRRRPPASSVDWVQQNSYQSQPPVNDSGSIGWGVLGFCIPIVGLILFLVWKDQKPRTAKVAGVGALISVIVGVIWYALVILVGLGSAMMY